MEVVIPGRTRTFQAGTVKACCKRVANLVTIWERPDLEIKTCVICGCKHRRLLVEPGRYDFRGGLNGQH